MGSNTRNDKLQRRLRGVEEAIAAHPFSSERMVEYQEIVERLKVTESPEEIDRQLAARNLPSLVEAGKLTARHMWSWGRLHRRRRVLERKIARME